MRTHITHSIYATPSDWYTAPRLEFKWEVH